MQIVANLFAVTDMVSYLTIQAGTNGTGRRFERGDQMSRQRGSAMRLVSVAKREGVATTGAVDQVTGNL